MAGGRSLRARVAGIVALVAALGLGPAGAVGGRCTPVEVPSLGPACPVPGGWQVVLRDGSTLLTHGLDAPPGHLGYTIPPTPPAEPVCAPAGEPRGVVVYARAVDRPDGYAAALGDIRSMIAYANGFLRAEATETGGRPVDYRMACEGGAVAVADVVLSTTASTTLFSSIVSDLMDRGYASADEKYWVWYDSPANGGGFGNIQNDAIGAPGNRNNFGPSYGVTFGHTLAEGGAWIMMHENGHNLGAVQHLAPNSSGGWHCNDGPDVMCYADGGSTSAYDPSVCAAVHFDCNHEDYFNTAPADSAYLDNAWNLGSPLDRFLQGCGRATGFLDVGLGGLAVEGTSARTIPLAGCGGARFALWGTLADVPVNVAPGTVRSRVPDLDVCWLAAGAPLGCDAARAFEVGTVPAGTTHAQVILRIGARALFTLSAF